MCVCLNDCKAVPVNTKNSCDVNLTGTAAWSCYIYCETAASQLSCSSCSCCYCYCNKHQFSFCGAKKKWLPFSTILLWMSCCCCCCCCCCCYWCRKLCTHQSEVLAISFPPLLNWLVCWTNVSSPIFCLLKNWKKSWFCDSGKALQLPCFGGKPSWWYI